MYSTRYRQANRSFNMPLLLYSSTCGASRNAELDGAGIIHSILLQKNPSLDITVARHNPGLQCNLGRHILPAEKTRCELFQTFMHRPTFTDFRETWRTACYSSSFDDSLPMKLGYKSQRTTLTLIAHQC